MDPIHQIGNLEKKNIPFIKIEFNTYFGYHNIVSLHNMRMEKLSAATDFAKAREFLYFGYNCPTIMST